MTRRQSGRRPAAMSRSVVETLREAREQVVREWPGRDATPQAMRAYHERAGELYARVAQTDPGHRHEALFWAAQERESARAAGDPAGESSTVVVSNEVDGNG